MIYVGGVPPGSEWQELKDHMKQAGNVEFVQVLSNEFGKSRGVGFVRYATAEEAQAAIAELNGSAMEGSAKPITVDLWTGQKPVTNKGRAKGVAGLAAGGGGGGCGKGGCYGKGAPGGGGFGGCGFGGCGFGGGGMSGKGGKGGGFFISWEQYQALLMGKGGKAGGKSAAAVAASASPGFGSRDPTFKVRVEGLPAGARWQDLKDHMKQAGTVEFCNVKGGIGEVRFSCAEEAANAVAVLNGSELTDTSIVVDFWSEGP